MSSPGKNAFECAHQNLRTLIRYLRHDLKLDAAAIRYQVEGVLHALLVEELYEQSQAALAEKPKGQ